ncbi:hypothetical protein JTB14_007180 [Gonioctena quinquepunctata]|nr:hypothetical protein JTB14_007180 [Gonioctena quinquepunctata]
MIKFGTWIIETLNEKEEELIEEISKLNIYNMEIAETKNKATSSSRASRRRVVKVVKEEELKKFAGKQIFRFFVMLPNGNSMNLDNGQVVKEITSDPNLATKCEGLLSGDEEKTNEKLSTMQASSCGIYSPIRFSN